MFTFDKTKRAALVVLGLAVATTAILIGSGFTGGSASSSAMYRHAPAGPWRVLADASESIAAGRTVVWTGNEMIVAGTNPGSDGTFIESREVAESYNPTSDTWRLLAAPPRTESYCRRSAVWTGKEMLVWGCSLLAFDPATNAWRRLPDPPTRQGIVAWTGKELIGWGGGCCGDVSDDGSAYNPETNTWRKLTPAPVGGQQSPAGAWTGRELVILSGRDPDGGRVDGAAYDPATDTWRLIARVPSRYQPVQAVSYGQKLYVLGLRAGATSLLELDVANNRWLDLGAVGRTPGVAVRAGNQILLLGGVAALEGLALYPETGAWLPFSAPRSARRSDPATVWTGKELIIWGGVIPSRAHTATPPRYLASGAAFRPRKASPPLPQCCGGG